MNAKLNATLPDTIPPPAPESESNSRKQFERRSKGERVPSGKQLPPPPAWMVKPLKPPRSRPPTSE